jgi:putative metal-binding protein
MKRRAVRIALAAAALAMLHLPLAPQAIAQTLKKNLTRSFDGEPYQKTYDFFTAAGTDAVLTFSRVIGSCPEIGTCTTSANCHGGTCIFGQCTGSINVYPTVGQVAVILKDDFCRAMVCGSGGGAFVPAECNPALYPCTTPCPVPTNCFSCPLAPGLCACGGGNNCPAADAAFQSSQVAFNENFQGAANVNGWVYSSATVHAGASDGFLELGVDPAIVPAANWAVAEGTVRFPLILGKEYVLFVKHSFSPLVGGLQCYPFGRMELTFDGRPDPCDEDQDGYTVAQDCNDGNPAIHPGQLDLSCNLVDENCNGIVDEDYVSEPDHWTPIPPQGAIEGRNGHTIISTGSTAIVWGGNVVSGVTQTGATFDPVSGLWTALPLGHAPPPRSYHSAVWTGTRMIVWGGSTASGRTSNGGQYDPSTGAWLAPTSLLNAPAPRMYHTAVWTGTRMIVWGGLDQAGNVLRSGGVYDPATDTWTPTSLTNAPVGGVFHTAVWTGTRMIVWGGGTQTAPATDTGAMYDPVGNTWMPLTTLTAPTARQHHTAVWTGTEMIVWGGTDIGSNALANGGRFVPALNRWVALSQSGAPAARTYHVAVWTGSDMLIWGGDDAVGRERGDGARYAAGTGTWSPMTMLDAPLPRALARATYLSGPGQMIVWGGVNPGLLGDGGLYVAGATCGIGACQRSFGTVCAGGTIQYQCSPGAPSAEVCNAVDDDCDGVVDDSIPPVVGSPDLSVSGSGGSATISWKPLPGGQAGDLVRGRISSLASSGGNFTVATEICLGNDQTSRSISDGGKPPVGDAYWYLSREVNSCSGPGTYDEGSSSQVGLRDAEIAASPVACP